MDADDDANPYAAPRTPPGPDAPTPGPGRGRSKTSGWMSELAGILLLFTAAKLTWDRLGGDPHAILPALIGLLLIALPSVRKAFRGP